MTLLRRKSYGIKAHAGDRAFLRTLRPETSLVQAAMGQKSAMRRAVGIEDWGESGETRSSPFPQVTPETEATHTIATIFSLSAQQLGLRPHGRSFSRLRGGCYLASSPIGRIGAVTSQVWFASLPCSQFPTTDQALAIPVEYSNWLHPLH